MRLQVANDLQDQSAPMEDGNISSLSRSSSSQAGGKLGHATDNDIGSDDDAHVSKTTKIEKKNR